MNQSSLAHTSFLWCSGVCMSGRCQSFCQRLGYQRECICPGKLSLKTAFIAETWWQHSLGWRDLEKMLQLCMNHVPGTLMKGAWKIIVHCSQTEAKVTLFSFFFVLPFLSTLASQSSTTAATPAAWMAPTCVRCTEMAAHCVWSKTDGSVAPASASMYVVVTLLTAMSFLALVKKILSLIVFLCPTQAKPSLLLLTLIEFTSRYKKIVEKEIPSVLLFAGQWAP